MSTELQEIRSISPTNEPRGHLFSLSSEEKLSSFLAKALYLGFSIFLYRRKILDPKFFSKNDGVTENKKFKTLSLKNPLGARLAQMFKSAAESVKLGYLKEISLVITENESDVECLEVFSFFFDYSIDGGVSARLSTSSFPGEDSSPPRSPKHASLDLHLLRMAKNIKRICQTQLTILPGTFSANFRVEYAKNAPNGYSVNGFKDCSQFYTLPKMGKPVEIDDLGEKNCNYRMMLKCYSIFTENINAAPEESSKPLEFKVPSHLPKHRRRIKSERSPYRLRRKK